MPCALMCRKIKADMGAHGIPLVPRIRICGHAVVAQEPEVGDILAELKSALHELTERLRRKSLEWLVSGEPESADALFHFRNKNVFHEPWTRRRG
jgi:hypothetical protein